MAKHRHSFLYRHSLSMVAVGLLIVWIVGYRMLDPKTHLGAFFGNAVADWSGSVVIILGTKFLYEVGSTESRPVKGKERSAWLDFLHRHSLLIFIVITGIGWAFLYVSMNAESKWGRVVPRPQSATRLSRAKTKSQAPACHYSLAVPAATATQLTTC